MKSITLARKPLVGTVANNVLAHGCGGLNIDGTRVGVSGGTTRTNGSNAGRPRNTLHGGNFGVTPLSSGRFPANLILQHLGGCRCDGVKKVKPSNGSGTAYEPAPKARGDTVYDGGWRPLGRTLGCVDEEGKETVANWICEDGCPVARLDKQSGVSYSSGGSAEAGRFSGLYGTFSGENSGDSVGGFGDIGGASRFFKQVKQ